MNIFPDILFYVANPKLCKCFKHFYTYTHVLTYINISRNSVKIMEITKYMNTFLLNVRISLIIAISLVAPYIIVKVKEGNN